jgi:hypothetical protein
VYGQITKEDTCLQSAPRRQGAEADRREKDYRLEEDRFQERGVVSQKSDREDRRIQIEGWS